jgi:D-glycero-D-manno-heptose 1,7-bisphosphate phosphatase
MNPAVFLDRDGVIIQNRECYVRDWVDVEFIPESLQALERLSQSTYKIIFISNQSAVGRGIISIAQAEVINQRIIEKIADAGGRVDASFICPHAPEDNCSCRKPLPGLIFQAAEALSIDLPSSVLVGDAITDIQAGSAAGIKRLVLVKTGRGLTQSLSSPLLKQYPNLLITDHLLSAVNIILSKSISQI